jgi:hypothetical protein
MMLLRAAYYYIEIAYSWLSSTCYLGDKLLSTLAIGQWFLNLLPNQAGAVKDSRTTDLGI